MPQLESVVGQASPDRRTITRVSEYRGEVAIAVAATQLGTEVTRTQATRIVQEWAEFFASGPTNIDELHFLTRTPRHLFDALAGQTQLQRLFVKWGDYEDLEVLQEMKALRVLRLGGASSVRDVAPLAALSHLTHLEIESIRRVHDLSPLQALRTLRLLDVGGDWMSHRVGHIESIAWMPKLEDLEHLLIHTLVVDDLDYTPLLRLRQLKAVRVMATRGMRPTDEELQGQLPWAQ